jgi:hypothetical protein
MEIKNLIETECPDLEFSFVLAENSTNQGPFFCAEKFQRLAVTPPLCPSLYNKETNL